MGQFKMIEDPGHGGRDPGGRSGSFYEKDVVLDTSLRFKEYMESTFEASVLLTRSTDKYVSLGERVRLANDNNADFFYSNHANAFNGNARGYEDFVWDGLSDISETNNIRQTIHDEAEQVVSSWGASNRGTKSANFFVLRNTIMPAVLGELLFVDNVHDQKLLKNNNFLDDMVQARAKGIAKAFNVDRKVKVSMSGDMYIFYLDGKRSHANRDVKNITQNVERYVKEGVKEIKIVKA